MLLPCSQAAWVYSSAMCSMVITSTTDCSSVAALL